MAAKFKNQLLKMSKETEDHSYIIRSRIFSWITRLRTNRRCLCYGRQGYLIYLFIEFFQKYFNLFISPFWLFKGHLTV